MAGPGRGSPQRVNPGEEPPATEDAEPNPHPWVKWKQEHKTGDKQTCEEYRRESLIKNKMSEQKCDIFEAKENLGN